jgi:hypothetical protein
MFPILAIMLKNPGDYDASMEILSQPLLQLIYERLNGLGRKTIKSKTATWYRYMDISVQTETL